MKIQMIGAALGAGAQDQRCAQGPSALHESRLIETLKTKGLEVGDFPILNSFGQASYLEALPLIAAFNKGLAAKVGTHFLRGEFPVVIGGDHSIAAGTWSGIANSLGGDLGLLWIDAHMDSHTVESSETGAVHGMPLAALLGHGEVGLSQIGTAKAKLKPENVCLLGVRSFEEGEARLLKELGVRVYGIDEIESRGFQICLREAHAQITRATAGFGITLDLDALDPVHFPSVGSPVDFGLRYDAVKRGLESLAFDPRFCALEIVEYNPSLDESGLSATMVIEILASTLRARQDAELLACTATGT
ncbi:MAG: arginase [Bdellovibrionaceae bacterium]|nr:arginase [Pseudobdellovibrionaceae bacterium]